MTEMPGLPDNAAAVDAITVAVTRSLPAGDFAAAVDALAVVRLPVPAPVPSVAALPAAPAFIRSQMPRMHLQNLLTGAWLHRDVQGISNPQITWTLNGAGTFTCTLSPPRPDLLDSSGNPVITEWQTACYLEEDGEIKFGGICTSSDGQGPQWRPVFTEFSGYPSGMPYEGPAVDRTGYEALDAVRDLWGWLQSQPDGDLGLVMGPGATGVLLGSQPGPPGAATTLNGAATAGSSSIKVHDASGFNAKMKITIGDETVTAGAVTSGNVITLKTVLQHWHKDGTTVAEVIPPVPYQLDWWNSTDCGQEIASIRAEAVFDYREKHSWNSDRTGVRHELLFGVPRIGGRVNLRFAEGENIVDSAQITRDGSVFANNVIGLGAGTGRKQVRSQASVTNGRLRRTFVYTDQTVTHARRMDAKAQRVLRAMSNIDTPSQVTVMNHPNAPFGAFGVGDDIYVQMASGWRKAGIWCRILQMTQDPTVNLMTLTLARSDSFTYQAESGQAGNL